MLGLFGILGYMEQKRVEGQPDAGDAQYEAFAKGKRQLAADIGERVLDVAHERKKSKELDIESAQHHIEAYQQKIEALRSDVDAKKRSLITKILNYKQLKELRMELIRTETIVQKREEEQKWRTEMIGYYDRIIEEEEQMGKLMEEAYADNELFDEAKRVELIEEEKGRSVMERAKKHNVFFMSDIVTAEWKPSPNNFAIDTKQLDFEDQLHIVLGLNPTIAVSTLSPDSKNRTFGNGAWGVLLSGGRITGGETNDAGTRATGLRSRAFHSKDSETIEGIDEAIEGRYEGKIKNSSYNELAVERPEVAGVYFKLEANDLPEDMQVGKDITLPRQFGDAWWGQVGKIMDTGAPMFVIERAANTVHMVYDIDMQNRSFKITPAYDPENVANMPGVYKQHLDDEHRRVSVTKVFDKTSHLLTQEEREQHEREKDRGNSDNIINVY